MGIGAELILKVVRVCCCRRMRKRLCLCCPSFFRLAIEFEPMHDVFAEASQKLSSPSFPALLPSLLRLRPEGVNIYIAIVFLVMFGKH